MNASSEGMSVDRTDTAAGGPYVRDDFVPPILKQYWDAVQRRRYVIMAIIAAAFAVGVAVTLLMHPVYTATAQLEIERAQKQVTNVEGLEAQNGAQDQEFYATQYA